MSAEKVEMTVNKLNRGEALNEARRKIWERSGYGEFVNSFSTAHQGWVRGFNDGYISGCADFWVALYEHFTDPLNHYNRGLTLDEVLYVLKQHADGGK